MILKKRFLAVAGVATLAAMTAMSAPAFASGGIDGKVRGHLTLSPGAQLAERSDE